MLIQCAAPGMNEDILLYQAPKKAPEQRGMFSGQTSGPCHTDGDGAFLLKD